MDDGISNATNSPSRAWSSIGLEDVSGRVRRCFPLACDWATSSHDSETEHAGLPGGSSFLLGSRYLRHESSQDIHRKRMGCPAIKVEGLNYEVRYLCLCVSTLVHRTCRRQNRPSLPFRISYQRCERSSRGASPSLSSIS